jgi:hypothetical protein
VHIFLGQHSWDRKANPCKKFVGLFGLFHG